jgi:zinc protease
LVREAELFTSISSHTAGTLDPGMLVISGRLKSGVELERAHAAVDNVIHTTVKEGVTPGELEKVKAQAESALEFGEVEVLNRAMNLAFATLSGDTSYVNTEGQRIAAVTQQDIGRVAGEVFQEDNATVMYYRREK